MPYDTRRLLLRVDFMTFTDLLLPPDLIAALAKQQINDPTPVQIAAHPVLMAGKDAYLTRGDGHRQDTGVPASARSRIDPAQAATQVVIVAPTHELAIQIHRQSCDLAQNAGRAIRSVLLIGGTATDRQIEKLKGKPHVVVGSPGRIVELIERGKLKTQAPPQPSSSTRRTGCCRREPEMDSEDRRRSAAGPAADLRVCDD